jgi:hypothetical protein
MLRTAAVAATGGRLQREPWQRQLEDLQQALRNLQTKGYAIMGLTSQESAVFQDCQSILEQELFALPQEEKVATFSWDSKQLKTYGDAGQVEASPCGREEAAGAANEQVQQQSRGRGYYRLPAKEVFEVSSSISSSSCNTASQQQLPFEKQLCKALLKFDVLGRKLLGSLSPPGPVAPFLSLLDETEADGTLAAARSLLHASYYYGCEGMDLQGSSSSAGKPAQQSMRAGDGNRGSESVKPVAEPAEAALTSSQRATAPPMQVGGAGDTEAAAAAGAGWQSHGSQAHHDRGLLTLITSSCPEGLEVQDPITGCWEQLQLGPEQMAVLVGATLTAATAGTMPTCRHRVLSRGLVELGSMIVCREAPCSLQLLWVVQ